MVYELRTYTSYPILPPERLPVDKEMERLMPVFERLGIKVVGVWNAIVGRLEEFYIMLEYKSIADWEEKRLVLENDLELRGIKKEIGDVTWLHETKLLKPTTYSPLR